MAERIEQYLGTVCAQVRWRRVRPALVQELRTHLEEQAAACRARGLSAPEAEAEAIRQMGSAEQVGLALDAVHQPKKQTAIMLLAGLCAVLGALLRVICQDAHAAPALAALLLTFGALCGGYFFDYRRLGRFAWLIYGAVFALGALCLYRGFRYAGGVSILGVGMSVGIESEYVVLLYPPAYALAVYALRGKKGGFLLALCAAVPFAALLRLGDRTFTTQVTLLSRLIFRLELAVVLLIAIRAAFFRVKKGWAYSAVLLLLALGLYLDVRSNMSRLAAYFSPAAIQQWRSIAQARPFADQLMAKTLRLIQQAGVSSAVPAWVWMAMLYVPMAAFLGLLLVRAAKLPNPLGKLLSLPAALMLIIRFAAGVGYQLSLFPMSAPLPFVSGNLFSVVDAALLGLALCALRQSACPEMPPPRLSQAEAA